MEQYISVPCGALTLHPQDFKAYALLRQEAEFPQPGVPLSVAAARVNLPFATLLASMAVLRLRGYIVVLPGIDSLGVMHERGDALAVQLVDQCLPVSEILRQDAAFPDFVRYCAGMEGQIYGGFSPDFIDLAGMDALNRAADDARRILDLWSSTEALPAGAEDAAGGAAVTGAGNARNAGRLPASGAKRATDGLPPKPF